MWQRSGRMYSLCRKIPRNADLRKIFCLCPAITIRKPSPFLPQSCPAFSSVLPCWSFPLFFPSLQCRFVCKNRKEVTDLVVILTAALLVVGIPFFLPRMHDRYFYFADVMTLICAFLIPKMIPAALLTEFASYLGYYAYLRGKYFLLLRFGSIALILVLIMLFFSLFRLLYSKQSHSFKFFRAK